MLLDASKFVVVIVEILQKLGNLEKFNFEIHGVLSDACVRHEQQKVTCFVMNADNLTTLCREGDVEANDTTSVYTFMQSFKSVI